MWVWGNGEISGIRMHDVNPWRINKEENEKENSSRTSKSWDRHLYMMELRAKASKQTNIQKKNLS